MSPASHSRSGSSTARVAGVAQSTQRPTPRHLRVVVLSLDTFGDLTLRQPLLRALLDAGHAVAVCVRAAYAELLPNLDARLKPIVTEVEPYRPAAWSVTRTRLQRTCELIATFEPQLLIAGAFSRTFADEWLLRSFPAAQRLGLLDPAVTSRLAAVAPQSELAELPVAEDALFTHPVTVERNSHETDKYRALADQLAGLNSADLSAPALQVTADDHKRAQADLRRLGLVPGRYLAVAAVGTQNTPVKQPSKAVIDAIVERANRSHDLAVLLIGAHDELPVMRELARQNARCAAWSGGTGDIGTVLGLLATARAYAGADTGLMHFAAALERPVLALFGGGTWPRFLPTARRAVCVRIPIPCFGCEWACRFGEPLCLTAMQPGIAADALDRLLADDAQLSLEIDGVASTALPLLQHTVGVALSAVETRTRRLEEADADRDARLTQIETLMAQLRISEADRKERGRQIDELQRIAATLREESAQRLQQVETLTELARRFEAESGARMEQIETLTAQLQVSEADREERGRQVDELQRIAATLREESVQRLQQVETLTERARRFEAESGARMEQIETLTAQLQDSEADRGERGRQIDELQRIATVLREESAQRLQQVETLTELARRFEAESGARMEQIETLTAQLQVSEADREKRGRQIDELQRIATALRDESAQRLQQVETLTELARRFEAESGARMEQIETLTTMAHEARADLVARVAQLVTELAAARQDVARGEVAGRALEGRLQDVLRLADRLTRRRGARPLARWLRWDEVEQLAQIMRAGPVGGEQVETDTSSRR